MRKLKFLDVVIEQLGDAPHESIAAEMDARFALLTLELQRLLIRLTGTFKLGRPE